jgi:hypothetical protein
LALVARRGIGNIFHFGLARSIGGGLAMSILLLRG